MILSHLLSKLRIYQNNLLAIYASMHFNYSVSQDKKLFSWGNSQSYVFGTRNENSKFKPKEVTTIFASEKVLQLSLRASRAIALTAATDDQPLPTIDYKLMKLETIKTKTQKKSKKSLSSSQKRSVQKVDESLIPVKDLRID